MLLEMDFLVHTAVYPVEYPPVLTVAAITSFVHAAQSLSLRPRPPPPTLQPLSHAAPQNVHICML